jgi:hypothetical protein
MSGASHIIIAFMSGRCGDLCNYDAGRFVDWQSHQIEFNLLNNQKIEFMPIAA